MVHTNDSAIKPESEKKVLPPLISKDEMEEFESYYPTVLNDLIKINEEAMSDMEIVADWIVKVMNYNVCGGKKLRGLMVAVTYKSLVKEVDPQQLKKAYLLGWIAEIFQGASLIADDVMDQSETRRGKPCWYKQNEVGMLAVNDAFLLENLANKLTHYYFSENFPEFLEIDSYIKEVLMKSILGQGLDCITCVSEDIVKSFTMQRYRTIVQYKTSYYTMFLPVALGIVLAGKGKDKDTMKKVEEVLLEIGHYFQVQDDYLDCFGDENVTGKIGTDIQDNKCTWLFVKAAEKCTPNEIQYLVDNYGNNDSRMVENVKNLYKNLDLPDAYKEYEIEAQTKIAKMVKELPEEIDEKIFCQIFLKIYQRCK